MNNLLMLDVHLHTILPVCLWLKIGTLHMQVLAMARPWQENVLKHNIAHTLQVASVGMILNLQVM